MDVNIYCMNKRKNIISEVRSILHRENEGDVRMDIIRAFLDIKPLEGDIERTFEYIDSNLQRKSTNLEVKAVLGEKPESISFEDMNNIISIDPRLFKYIVNLFVDSDEMLKLFMEYQGFFENLERLDFTHLSTKLALRTNHLRRITSNSIKNLKYLSIPSRPVLLNDSGFFYLLQSSLNSLEYLDIRFSSLPRNHKMNEFVNVLSNHPSLKTLIAVPFGNALEFSAFEDQVVSNSDVKVHKIPFEFDDWG